MGMVFQSFNLFGHLNVIENIMQAQMDILNRPKSEAYDRGMELLKRVGLAGRKANYPDELSGGQKQRVAIARTLAMDPEVILFDEPTSALDPTMVGEVQSVIRSLTNTDKTMLIVTHEMNFARAICSRVFYMDQGGIYEEGTPDQIFDNPQKDLTRRFIRRLRVLELEIDGVDFDFAGAGTDIDGYCLQNDVSPRTKYLIRLAFEELTCDILKPVLDYTPVQITVEYSEKDDDAEITASYGGERFDPAESGDGFSYGVLKSTVKSLSYRYDQNGERANTVKILI
jgi:polar amino acid transport system ATP-binding protein